MIKVVRGNPTPEELAAALAVVRVRAAAAAAPQTRSTPRAQWSDPARIARAARPLPGPGAWARTYWPA
ncbi:acyl-CoA carboxylase subunit epsilon [Streptomyces sp. NBC_01218]|uniref:acyl-CoA carboxylase subunit epsilon n=1 Tax=unclassified Streptomyces TaxID=2593676 RepID=UPI0023B91B32|nr:MULTISPECIES: acyl-CoA carboxylase subunit epsilon [unclassified Streptomyces]WEH39979.1 acyl-CoA carboxylase subunit epsilon [Streptomyces sp. AM 2-1-1]WSQ51670.1 acyl-CoA carboxylase subunit epsilon [Streptomyces sp. NBC_01218]